MADSQESTAIYTEPPMDITTEMMSPTTTALLANMNVSLASATGSVSRVGVGGNNDASISMIHVNDKSHDSASHLAAASNGDINHLGRRQPLGSIDKNRSDSSSTNIANKKTHCHSKRIMTPNESNYRQNYDAFVTKTITRYAARMQTNLRSDTLPNYKEMSLHQKSSALASVDQLLERLANGVNVNATMSAGGQSNRSSSNLQQSNDTFGSATTLGIEQHNETFGSATTLGGGGEQQHNETFGSATTLGLGATEQSKGKSSESADATSLGNNKSFGGEEQSVSLLEESMCLLSDNESENDNNRADDELRNDHHNLQHKKADSSDAAAPIERTRNYQNNPRRSTSLAMEEEMLDTSTPPFSTHKLSSKRCASNSGKRGLKARHRSSRDGEEEDDSLLLGNFSGLGNDDGGMFLHDQEDVFSCGSPIQRRFSHDGLESPYCDDEMRDRLHDLPDHYDGKKGKSTNANGNESEAESRFSHIDENDDVSFGGNNDYYDDYDDVDDDDGGLGRNWDGEDEQPRTQNQLSQWSTFRNADAKMTISQMNEVDDEEDSPVRRRAIRFDGASQQMAVKQSQRRSQRDNNFGGSDEEEEEVADDLAAEGQTKKSTTKKKANTTDEEDPIQTVRNLCRRAKTLEEQGVDSSLLEEVAPIDVRLRDGMHFRMDPLRCRQDKEKKKKSSSLNQKSSKSTKKKTKSVSIVHPKPKGNPKSKNATRCESSDSDNSLSDPEPSFKDPISDFPSRVAARLNAGLSFLIEKEGQQAQSKDGEVDDDDDNDDLSSAVLLSMTIRQIMCVTSKLLIQTRKSTRLHQRSKNGSSLSSARKRFTPSSSAPPKDDDYLAGGTLIVLRGKEDIEQWEVALREYTSLSVLNHAGMQSNLRKLVSMAGKCAGFDIVLTTYDSIKTKEVTVPVDSSGCAILGGNSRSNNDDGWFTSRTQGGTQSGVLSPQKCHQLSVLHRMSWYRVIFMDILGRKGFLTKPGTARAQAAVAINSKSRFALFEKEEDATSKAEAKLKNDRRQLRSIMTALHLPENMKLDKIGTFILDINKAGKTSELDLLDSSSSDESGSESERSDDDLSEPW